MRLRNNVLLANQKEERPKTETVMCEEIKAAFQSFQGSATDLELIISHLLITDSRSCAWLRFGNRNSN